MKVNINSQNKQSFGSVIPIRVSTEVNYINRLSSTKTVPCDVQVNSVISDLVKILEKRPAKNQKLRPDLIQQFASNVKDYKEPFFRQPGGTLVKAVRWNNQDYLLTGRDALDYFNIGKHYGVSKKGVSSREDLESIKREYWSNIRKIMENPNIRYKMWSPNGGNVFAEILCSIRCSHSKKGKAVFEIEKLTTKQIVDEAEKIEKPVVDSSQSRLSVTKKKKPIDPNQMGLDFGA